MKKNSMIYLCAAMVAVILSVGIMSCVTTKKKTLMAQNKPLTETYWILTHVKGENIPKCQITPHIVFGIDGRYSGNLGCNQFFGNYHSRKDKIKMEYEGATKRLCQNMKVEKLFMQALHTEFKKYKVDKEILYLMDADGEVLRFVAGVKPEPKTSESPTE